MGNFEEKTEEMKKQKYKKSKELRQEYHKYEEEIITKQKIALLVESIIVLGQYKEIKFSYDLPEKDRLQFDIANTMVSYLLEELQDNLTAENYKINFYPIRNDGNIIYYGYEEHLDNIHEYFKELGEMYPLLRTKLGDLYQNMVNSFDHIQRKTGKKQQIYLIQLLLDNGQAEKVIELFVSENTTTWHKICFLEYIIENYPSKIYQIFDIVPSSYLVHDVKYNSKEIFKKRLDNCLAECFRKDNFFSLKYDYIKKTIIQAMKCKYPDEMTKTQVKDEVKFFVEHNLVNINDIDWTYKEQEITSAATGYITRNPYLGDYLYSLPSYQKRNDEIRKNSDKIILETLLKRDYYDFRSFIRQQSYENTPDKLNHIMQIILENPNIIDNKQLDETINILLRKTKKQDYKEVKRIIADIQANMQTNQINFDPTKLKEKRQELTATLQMISSLLNQTTGADVSINQLKYVKK